MNTSHLIWSAELKVHFSSKESEAGGLTSRMCFSGLGWGGLHQQGGHPEAHISSSQLSNPTLALRPGTQSQITALNNQSNHSSTCQAAGDCYTAHRSHGDGEGEAAGGAEMMSLQCIQERDLSQVLWGLELYSWQWGNRLGVSPEHTVVLGGTLSWVYICPFRKLRRIHSQGHSLNFLTEGSQLPDTNGKLVASHQSSLCLLSMQPSESFILEAQTRIMSAETLGLHHLEGGDSTFVYFSHFH